MLRSPGPPAESADGAPYLVEEPVHQGPEQLVLREVEKIHDLLVTDASTSKESIRSGQERLERIANISLIAAIAAFGLFLIESLSNWLRIFLACVTLLGAAINLCATSIAFWRELLNRRVDTMRELASLAKGEKTLIGQLLPYSRTALLHVAATAKARDQRIAQRIAFLLGPNRAGGLLGAFFLTLGIFSAGKYLQESGVTFFNLGPVTSGHVLIASACLFALTVLIMLAGARVSSLSPTAELLERVAALKKNLADEPKDPRA